jgi:hypothetical protein
MAQCIGINLRGGQGEANAPQYFFILGIDYLVTELNNVK